MTIKEITITDDIFNELVERTVNDFGNIDSLIALVADKTARETPIIFDGANSVVEKLAIMKAYNTSNPGSKVNSILKNSMGDRVIDAVNNTINDTPVLRNITTGQVEDLTRAMGDIVGSNPKGVKITKRGLTAKVGELLRSPKFYRSIAIGAGCGILSNMVGIAYSEKTTADAKKELADNVDDIPGKLLTNGLTYRMIIETKTDGKVTAQSGIKAIIEKVNPDNLKQQERMTRELSGKDKIVGTTLAWSPKLHKLQPQERILNEMKLSTSVTAFRDMLKGTNIDKEDRDAIVNILTTPLVQKVVHRYSNKEGKEPIKINETIVLESWIGSIIAIDGYTDGDLTREYEGNSTIIKERGNKLVNAMKKAKAKGITEEIAREMYPDKEDADKFLLLVQAWEHDFGSNNLEE
jgi:hypothetical protein